MADTGKRKKLSSSEEEKPVRKKLQTVSDGASTGGASKTYEYYGTMSYRDNITKSTLRNTSSSGLGRNRDNEEISTPEGTSDEDPKERVDARQAISKYQPSSRGRQPSRGNPAPSIRPRFYSRRRSHIETGSDGMGGGVPSDSAAESEAPIRSIPTRRAQTKSADPAIGRGQGHRLGSTASRGSSISLMEDTISHHSGSSVRSTRSFKNLRESPESSAEEANHVRDQKDDDFEINSDEEQEGEHPRKRYHANPQISAAIQTLKITPRDMAEYFRSKRIPHCIKNPPAESAKALSASTVQCGHLRAHGWDFLATKDLRSASQPVSYTPAEIYQNLDVSGYGVPWNATPFDSGDLETTEKDGTRIVVLRQAAKLDRGIKHGRQLWAQWMVTARPRYPIEWRNASVTPLTPLPERFPPKMPKEFTHHFMPQELVPTKLPSPCPSHDFSPQKPGAQDSGSGLRETGSHEDSGSSSETEEPNEDIDPRFQAAKSFIQENGLDSTLPEDAQHLAEFLEQKERDYRADIKADERVHHLHQSKKNFCLLLESMNLPKKSFSYADKAKIEEEDSAKCTGNSARTEDTHDLTTTAMEINLRWIKFNGIDCSQGNKSRKGKTTNNLQRSVGEAEIVATMGPLIMWLFRFDDLEILQSQALEYPKHMRLFGTTPQPDFAARAAGDEWPWPATLLPTVTSGDFKTTGALADYYEAQLALNSQFILQLFVLIHLDTRKMSNAPFPPWMWVYSWVCTSMGFSIYSHYPSVRVLNDGNDYEFKFVSFKLTDQFEKLWDYDRPDLKLRLNAKAVFDHIASHSSWVLEQVRRWAQARGNYRAGGIMNQLIARAHLEDNNYKWLLERVNDGV